MDRKIQIDIKDATWFVEELRALFSKMADDGMCKLRVFFETASDHVVAPTTSQGTWKHCTGPLGGATFEHTSPEGAPEVVVAARGFCYELLQKLWSDPNAYFDISGHVDFDVRTRDVLLAVDEKVLHTLSSAEYIYAEPLADGAA